MFMDADEMRIFDQALYGLIAKAAEAGRRLTPQEIARLMIIVQVAKVYDPDEFDRLVLLEDFADFEMDTFIKLPDTPFVEVAGALAYELAQRRSRAVLKFSKSIAQSRCR